MSLKETLRFRLIQKLEALQASGVQTVPRGLGELVFPDSGEPTMGDPPTSSKPAAPVQPANAGGRERVSAPPVSHAATAVKEYGQQIAPEHRPAALEVIQREVATCTSCPELCERRKNTVFGVGNPNARLCFVGEGPGADEDRQGEPFVGAAGQLLDKIIGACKMSRKDVYILNTVKCRPPGNRNPSDSELANCWPYALRQLDVIQPEFICCLGSVAARTVLNTKSSISKLRGQFHSFRGSQVVVTYHPAYLLRTPTAKKHTWNDMKMLMSAMGVEL